jgi:hypothetical protein
LETTKVNNPIARRLAELLEEETEPGSGITRAEALAEVLLQNALAGSAPHLELVLRALEEYDPALDPSWEED